MERRQIECINTRANTNFHLRNLYFTMHVEHHRLVAVFKEKNPSWDEETLYQEARLNVCSTLMKYISLNKFLIPIILGPRYALNDQIQVELLDIDMWRQLHAEEAEMLVDSVGIHMFPVPTIRVTGMNLKSKYSVFLELELQSPPHRDFIYAGETNGWELDDEVDKCSFLKHLDDRSQPNDLISRQYTPKLGRYWMTSHVAFDKAILSSNLRIRKRRPHTHFYVEERRQYSLTVVVEEHLPHDETPLVKKFQLPFTDFITTDSYKNAEFSTLKTELLKQWRGVSEYAEDSADTSASMAEISQHENVVAPSSTSLTSTSVNYHQYHSLNTTMYQEANRQFTPRHSTEISQHENVVAPSSTSLTSTSVNYHQYHSLNTTMYQEANRQFTPRHSTEISQHENVVAPSSTSLTSTSVTYHQYHSLNTTMYQEANRQFTPRHSMTFPPHPIAENCEQEMLAQNIDQYLKASSFKEQKNFDPAVSSFNPMYPQTSSLMALAKFVQNQPIPPSHPTPQICKPLIKKQMNSYLKVRPIAELQNEKPLDLSMRSQNEKPWDISMPK